MLRNYYKKESWSRFVDLSLSTFILDLLLELNRVSCVCYIKTEKQCRDKNNRSRQSQIASQKCIKMNSRIINSFFSKGHGHALTFDIMLNLFA